MRYVITPIFKYLYALTGFILTLLEYAFKVIWYASFKEADTFWHKVTTQFRYEGDDVYLSYWTWLKRPMEL